MVFTGVNEDAIPKPVRNLERTPPKAKKKQEIIKNTGGMGGLMGRDDPSPTATPVRGPVKRSPARKIENKELFSDTKLVKEAYEAENINLNRIQRQDRIERSPVYSPSPNRRGINLTETKATQPLEKQHSVPMHIHPLKIANDMRERRTSPHYNEEPHYDQLSLQRQENFHQAPNTYSSSQNPSELNNFEDRVDDLISQTRNQLDDFSPKQNFGTVEKDLSSKYAMSPQQPVGVYYPDAQIEAVPMNYPGQIQPQVMPVPVSYPPQYQMAYYGPVPVGQNIVPGQGFVQPMMQPHTQQFPPYPPQIGSDNMGQYNQPPQIIPGSNMPMNSGQPMYQVFYPPQNQGSP